MKPYLLIVTNLYCNYGCNYCIQQKSSLDVRKNPKKIDVDAVLKFLKRNRIHRRVSVMGGEATLHPDFERLIDGLERLYRKIVITTNLNGKWYEEFYKTLEKMKKWGRKIQWNTTYHPAWMDTDAYIERIRAIREAGLWVKQIASPDSKDLTEEIAVKLHNAGIGWKVQILTGRNENGKMAPENWDDVNSRYKLEFDPTKYIKHYDEYANECEDAGFGGNHLRDKPVKCATSRFLIGPDNMVYPCHSHLYMENPDYTCGSIHDVEMKNFRFKWSRLFKRWIVRCKTKCNPCDFRVVKTKTLINY
ncbi:MAG: hypothetical protein IEMM0002_0833 [bacterium]|nr:MAG: hypothetical protein IEMM0002_0833 [bacterium]